jgi:hypothetical protein
MLTFKFPIGTDLKPQLQTLINLTIWQRKIVVIGTYHIGDPNAICYFFRKPLPATQIRTIQTIKPLLASPLISVCGTSVWDLFQIAPVSVIDLHPSTQKAFDDWIRIGMTDTLPSIRWPPMTSGLPSEMYFPVLFQNYSGLIHGLVLHLGRDSFSKPDLKAIIHNIVLETIAAED